MQTSLNDQFTRESGFGIAKSLLIFSLLWIGPLAVLAAVSVLLGNAAALQRWDINFFLAGYFACTAIANSVLIPLFAKLGLRPLATFILTAVSTWLMIFAFDLLYGNAVLGNVQWRVMPIRALLGVAVFSVGYFLVRLFTQPRQEVDFQFNESFWYYARLSILIALPQGFFIGSIFVVELWHKAPAVLSVYVLGAIGYGLLSATTSLVAILALTRLRYFRSRTVLLVAFAFVACMVVGTVYGVSALPHIRKIKIVVIGLFPAFATASAMVFSLIQRNTARHQQRKFSRLDRSLSKRNSEYIELRQQTNPHFFFNNLNMLLGLVESDPEKALVFGRRLANVYRKFLKPDGQDFVSLADEMAFVSEYLEIYRAKFGSSFALTIDMDVSEGEFVLAHALQEIVDNVFKHNILDEERPIALTIFREGEALAIRNSVVFREAAESAKTGLANIQRRYELLTQKRLSFIGTPTDFTVYLPILAME